MIYKGLILPNVKRRFCNTLSTIVFKLFIIKVNVSFLIVFYSAIDINEPAL